MSAPTKARLLGPWLATALVVGNMVGSGVFLLPASLASFGWNGVLAWGLTTGGALTLALVIARLSAVRPHSGGPVGVVTQVFGPFIGALIGWSCWVSWWTAAATVAIAAVSYLSVFAPILATPGIAALAAIVLIAALTLLNLRGARDAGRFQLVTTLLKLMPLVAVVVILSTFPARGVVLPPLPAEGFSLAAITSAAALTLWALVGFESAGLAADKLSDPARDIARSTIGGTLTTGVLYIVVCSGIVLTLPAATLASSNAPFALFLETYWSHGAALTVAAFAAISAIGALNGFILIQGEIPLTMARVGVLPGWFGKTDDAGTPRRMLIVSSVLAAALVAANAAKTTAALFTFLALLSTSATLWLYLALALAALRLRVVIPVAAIGALYSLWTLWGAGIEASLLSLILMLTVLPIYAMRSRALAKQTA